MAGADDVTAGCDRDALAWSGYGRVRTALCGVARRWSSGALEDQIRVWDPGWLSFWLGSVRRWRSLYLWGRGVVARPSHLVIALVVYRWWGCARGMTSDRLRIRRRRLVHRIRWHQWRCWLPSPYLGSVLVVRERTLDWILGLFLSRCGWAWTQMGGLALGLFDFGQPGFRIWDPSGCRI